MHDRVICLETTLNLSDKVVRAKERAAETGQTLTRLIENGSREHLSSPALAQTGYRLRLLIKHGSPAPGVAIEDRDSLYEKVEGSV